MTPIMKEQLHRLNMTLKYKVMKEEREIHRLVVGLYDCVIYVGHGCYEALCGDTCVEIAVVDYDNIFHEARYVPTFVERVAALRKARLARV